jgi:hypothetical protein
MMITHPLVAFLDDRFPTWARVMRTTVSSDKLSRLVSPQSTYTFLIPQNMSSIDGAFPPLFLSHVLKGAYTYDDLCSSTLYSMPTCSGDVLTVEVMHTLCGGRDVVLNGASRIVHPDIPFTSSLVHVISDVLRPG